MGCNVFSHVHGVQQLDLRQCTDLKVPSSCWPAAYCNMLVMAALRSRCGYYIFAL